MRENSEDRIPETTAEYARTLPDSIDELGLSEMMPEDDLKSAINEALYPMVPKTMTMGDFEILTIVVFRAVWQARGCK